MPFQRHVIDPKYVCHRTRRKEDETVSLHECGNFVLTSLIVQLSSICEKANQIFGDLLGQSRELSDRMKELKTRMVSMENTINGMDSAKEQVGMGFNEDKKVVYRMITEHSRYFQSDTQLDTGLFMPENQPQEVTVLRNNTAEAMPALHLLDEYREDNKLCAKIYSNPDLFFLAWQDSLQQMIAEQTYRSQMRTKRTVRQTKVKRVKRAKPSRIQQAQKLKMGAEFVEEDEVKQDEEDEYCDDEEEWSSSEDEQQDGMVNGNSLKVDGHPIHRKSRKTTKKVAFQDPTPRTPESMMNGNLPVVNGGVHPPPPPDDLPPPPPLSLDSLSIDEDLPPPLPMTEQDYSGVSADYNVQSMLDSINAVMWASKT